MRRTAIFPPQYLGSTGYYAAMKRYDLVVVDTQMRYDKRFKSIHRTVIAGNHGPMMLTVPVSHGTPETDRKLRWDDVTVSAHGNWWDVHRGALESAYGRTPYFEFYIDSLLPFLRKETTGTAITDFDLELDAVIRSHLGITTRLTTRMPETENAEEADDLRRADFSTYFNKEYYQVRADRLGFMSNMSVLDLLFNMGPEAGSLL